MNMYRRLSCFLSGYDRKHYMPMNVKYIVLFGRKKVKSVAELGKIYQV